MSWQKIKALKEERAQIVGEMQSILKTAETEKRDLTTEQDAKFTELNAKAEAKDAEIQRYEKLSSLEQQSAANPGANPGREDVRTENRTDEEAAAKEYRAQFMLYLRGQIGQAQLRQLEQRALTVGATGVVGDRPFSNLLFEAQKHFAGVRDAGATIMPSANGNPVTVPFLDDTSNTGQIVAENTTNNTAADADTTGFATLGAYKFDSKWIKLSTEMAQDTDFPLEAFINKIAGERIGRAYNTYSTTGTGTGQPKGFTVNAASGKVAAATNAITYEELLDLVHSVDPAYRASGRCVLMMHDLTLAAIRKLKDGDNRYIFSLTPGSDGSPGTILGYKYVINNDMAQLTSGVSSKVVAFGDFSNYVVRDVSQPVVIVAKELFSGDGLIGYRVFSRHDGTLINANAVKLLKLAAS